MWIAGNAPVSYSSYPAFSTSSARGPSPTFSYTPASFSRKQASSALISKADQIYRMSTHSRTRAASPLAPELVLDILEMVYADEMRSTKKAVTLKSCALVCRRWAPIAQSLLWRSVRLEQPRAAGAFGTVASNMRSTKARFLRECVQTLEVLVADEEDGRVITQSAFARLVRLCPNLEELKLFYYCLRPLDSSTLELLRSVPAPRALFVSSAQHPAPVWDLLTVWPSVQQLEVRLMETDSDFVTEAPTGKWSPYEVRWIDEADSGEEHLPRLMRPGSLRVLQLAKTPSEAFFSAMMETHGPYLRSLKLRGVREEYAEHLSHATELEEFQYSTVPTATVLNALVSRNLEHLSFQQSDPQQHVSIKHVTEFVQRHASSKYGSNLRVVTYNGCGDPTKDPELLILARTCRLAGIDLRLFADMMHESEPLNGVPASFPRATPLTQRRAVSLAPVVLRKTPRAPRDYMPAPSPGGWRSANSPIPGIAIGEKPTTPGSGSSNHLSVPTMRSPRVPPRKQQQLAREAEGGNRFGIRIGL